MVKSFLKPVSVALSVFMMLSVLVGCGKNGDNKLDSNKGSNVDVQFPLAETHTLRYWVPLGGSVGVVQNFNEMGMYKELEKKTNVKIDFVHPVEGQIKEQFNIMIASRNFPDIIDGMSNYAGGLTKAYEDKVIIRLNDLMGKYAPNLSGIYEEYPFLVPYIMNENGDHLGVPFLRGGAILRQGDGPIFRKDWLKDLNIGIPETIDDWTTTLRAFKDKKGVRTPLVVSTAELKKNSISGAFGIATGIFVDDGEVKFGAYDSRYKEYLETLNLWYKEGLLDPEFGTINAKIKDSRILNNEGGAFIGVLGNNLQRYLTLKNDKNDSFDLQPVPYPVKKAGDIQAITTLSSTVSSTNYSITTSCKNPEIALAWLDYAYGKEGHMIYNFGVEGESYVMDNGEPMFTELLTKNPEGKAFSTVGRSFARAFGAGPMVQDTKYGDQFFAMPVQKEAVNIWGKFTKEAEEANHNYLGQLTPDEITAITSKQNQVNTYVDENFVKFVMGTTPLSEFDNYIAQLKRMGIEEIIDINQKAHDRFITKYPNYKIPYDFDVSEYFWSK